MRRPKEARTGAPTELVSLDLVERCKNGDEAAWRELVEATHREVYTLCLRILRDPHDAAEATQDAYLKAWRGLQGFRGDALFTTWLYRVASNAAISKHRTRSRRRTHETGTDDVVLSQIPGSASTEAAAGARVELEQLEGVLRALPEIHRTALVLRDVYEMSIEEIADQLKISETAAKVRVHRARKALKNLMFPAETGAEEGSQ